MVGAYSEAKRSFVSLLRSPSMWHHLTNKRKFRDWAKAMGLYPPGTNVHLVDQAAFDAVGTCIRHIESVIASSHLKARIWRRFRSEDERRYAYACLARYQALGVLNGGQQDSIARYLHRVLREVLASTWPTVTLSRSMALDETLYTSTVVERPGTSPSRRQYVRVVGPRQNEPIAIPLAGTSRVPGNIRLVLDEGEERAFAHVTYEMTPLPGPASGPDLSMDWGITEVCTDEHGVKHGQEYGRVLTSATEQRNRTGRARGKLWAITKKNAGSKRTRHIARNNLGTKKQTRRRMRTQAALRTIAGAAVKEVVYGEPNRTRARGRVAHDPSKRPRLLIVEDLAHLRGKARSKKISRTCSSWARAENEERMAVHAYLGGSEVKTVNAAYTSQTCPDPDCGYVLRDNRNGDRFHCRNPYWDCNWQGDADQVAAMNLKSRIDDPEIHRYTPHTEVKKILEGRSLRRLESRRGGSSVPSPLNGTVAVIGDDHGLPDELTATAHGRTPSKPQRVHTNVGGVKSSDQDTDSQSPVFLDGTGEAQRLESEKKRNT
ncbi:MAG: zinc ribbon domain-containing protein [Acidimicrobiales bacterium]